MPLESVEDGETYVELFHGYSEQPDDVGLEEWLERVAEEGIKPRGYLEHKDTGTGSAFDDYVCFYDADTAPRELLQFVEAPSLRVKIPASEVLVHRLVEGEYADEDAVEQYDEYDGPDESLEYLVEGKVEPEYIEELHVNGHPDREQFALDARWDSFQEWGV